MKLEAEVGRYQSGLNFRLKTTELDIFCHLSLGAIQFVFGGRHKLRDYHIYEDSLLRGMKPLKLDFFVKLL